MSTMKMTLPEAVKDEVARQAEERRHAVPMLLTLQHRDKFLAVVSPQFLHEAEELWAETAQQAEAEVKTYLERMQRQAPQSGTSFARASKARVVPVPSNNAMFASKFTIPQSAKILGVSPNKLGGVIRKGQIPVVRIDGKVMLFETDLENYLKGNYGPMREVDTPVRTALQPLPTRVRNSPHLKKAI